MTEQELANIIWNIKEIIRNLYDDSEVEDVILPFTLLRRLDCVLENSYESVLEELNKSAENVSGDFGAKAPRKPMIISE